MLFPKQTKFKKQFKGLIKGQTNRGNLIKFGDYALLVFYGFVFFHILQFLPNLPKFGWEKERGPLVFGSLKSNKDKFFMKLVV